MILAVATTLRFARASRSRTSRGASPYSRRPLSSSRGSTRRCCASCFKNLTFNIGQRCTVCDEPLTLESELCDHCHYEPPHFNSNRSVTVYEPTVASMVLRYKNGGALNYSKPFAKWLATLFQKNALPDEAILVPIPLHFWRYIRRGYNQSALLTHALQKELQQNGLRKQTNYHCLKRQHHTKTQRFLTLHERRANVEEAFYVPPKYREKIKGKTIVLIDDICTTGATLSAAAKALKDGGATEVHCLTIAKAPLHAVPKSQT